MGLKIRFGVVTAYDSNDTGLVHELRGMYVRVPSYWALLPTVLYLSASSKGNRGAFLVSASMKQTAGLCYVPHSRNP